MLAVVVSLVSGVLRLAGPDPVPVVCRPTQGIEVANDSDARVASTLQQTLCAAHERMEGLTHLANTDLSKLALELAVAPTFAVLDEVARLPSARWRFMAHALRGDLYVEMSVRFRHADDDTDEHGANLRVAGWLASARRAYADARTIADAHPELLLEL